MYFLLRFSDVGLLILRFETDYAGWADKIVGDSFNADDGI